MLPITNPSTYKGVGTLYLISTWILTCEWALASTTVLLDSSVFISWRRNSMAGRIITRVTICGCFLSFSISPFTWKSRYHLHLHSVRNFLTICIHFMQLQNMLKLMPSSGCTSNNFDCCDLPWLPSGPCSLLLSISYIID